MALYKQGTTTMRQFYGYELTFRTKYKQRNGSTKNATKAYKRYIAAGERRTRKALPKVRKRLLGDN